MNEQRTFTMQSLIAVFVVNGIMLAILFYRLAVPIQANNQLIAFWAIGGALTVVLSLITMFLGRRAIEGAAADAAASARIAAAESAAKLATAKPSPPEPPKPVVPAKPAPPPDAPAIQILSILQRQGRLIDFLQEDIAQFKDAQIGAAVRNIHEGCKQALTEHVTLEPVFTESEGSKVTIDADFDANAIRLTGNVAGDPPFTGTLQHKGWRVAKLDLPDQVAQAESKIVAAAEVEV